MNFIEEKECIGFINGLLNLNSLEKLEIDLQSNNFNQEENSEEMRISDDFMNSLCSLDNILNNFKIFI